jgi:Raf kinase inhibitor-like YbhB/YbcL family protein
MTRLLKNLLSVSLLIALGVSAQSEKKMAFAISSPAVKGAPEVGFSSKITSDGRIDEQYTAKESDPPNTKSFPVEWKGLPEGTKSLALIYDDPDAKPVMATFGVTAESFIHWLAADISPLTKRLKEDASVKDSALIQGKNSAGTIGYMGPKPPSNIPQDAKQPIIHIYRLTVYALSSELNLKSGFTIDELKSAMNDKVLGTAELNMSYNN